MRYCEIISGLRIPVSNEEQDILDQVGTGFYAQDDFDERSGEVARLMISRGLLNTVEKDGKILVSLNSPADAWRF